MVINNIIQAELVGKPNQKDGHVAGVLKSLKQDDYYQNINIMNIQI